MLMKSLIICSLLALGLFLGSAQAGEVKEIVLKDGSVLTGEVVSLNNGIYTVKSDILGTIKLEESKVRAIQERSASPGPALSSHSSATGGEVKSLQEKMMSDKEVMSLIQSLQNDPEFKKLMEDPKIMQAVNAGDVATLSADPRFMKLLNNPTVHEIQKKVQ
jgi:hypothetical protein